ncbi:MAG TPA: hypothetical protein PKH07_01495 [bacterium]|nr:hypothetical protein [bacterium]
MRRLFVGVCVICLSLAAIGYSFSRQFEIYEEDLTQGEFAFFEGVSERILVSDATFGGVFISEKTGRFISTYDRSQPRGREACPT